jgi:hypothetical protein
MRSGRRASLSFSSCQYFRLYPRIRELVLTGDDFVITANGKYSYVLILVRRLFMCRKLIFLSSFVLVFALIGHAYGGAQASNPNPANNATGVDLNPTLSWSPGDFAAFHDVYFGTSYIQVNVATRTTPVIYKGRQTDTTYSPGALNLCQIYYWRIDEVNDFNMITKGSVWNFKTTCSADSNTCVSPPWGMVAWWPLDETVGDTSEEIVNNNDGTWMSAPTPVTGKVKVALDFNGVDYVEVQDDVHLNFGTGNFSIDAWVKTSTTSGIKTILDKRSGTEANPTGFALSVLDGDLVIQIADGTWTNYESTLLVANGNWNHVAVTMDRDSNNGLKLYVNGVSQSFNPMAHQGNLTNNANLLIGGHHYHSSTRFTGSIDEVELFNRALDASEILAIYQAGSAGKCKCAKAQTYRDDIKWSQPPDYRPLGCINGWDEESIYYYDPDGPIVADDWVCMDGRPITNIHWWGSFKGWTEPNHVPPYDMPSAFHIGIWTNVPDSISNPDDFSHPGQMIWENICDSFVWSYAGCDVDPRNIDKLDTCFQFDLLLSQDKWFYQYGNEPNGTVYWLSIAAIYDGDTPVHPWGWKTRPHFYSDDAVRILPLPETCDYNCTNPTLTVFRAGDLNIPDQNAHPSQELIQALGQTPVNFGEPLNNQRFGHTFTGLPDCIKAAQLDIHMKATGDIPSTDSMCIGIISGPNGVGGYWGKSLVSLFGSWDSALRLLSRLTSPTFRLPVVA